MVKKLFAWIQRYERHLSAVAMLAGFVVDNLVFTRIDLWQTQALFALYAGACFVAIPLLHWVEMRGEKKGSVPRWRLLLPLITQFALGGFWSGFVIFYGRSAVLGVSWPFLIFLVLVFLGSEYFHRYHERLVFTSVLFFLALYLSAIFMVPIYTKSIGTGTFLVSGLIALVLFALFTILLRSLARERFLGDVWRIRVGATIVLLVINVSYFTNILPPLPLSAEQGGIYHEVWRAQGYQATKELSESWQVKYLGGAPTLHVIRGEWLSAYSAVFAPTTLSTEIMHEWEWFDPTIQKWVTKATIGYPIIGGRDGGYKGYSTVPMTSEGRWRVTIQTADGRTIDRIPFSVVFVETQVPTLTITLP